MSTELETLIQDIKTANTPGENTALRVGTTLELLNSEKITADYTYSQAEIDEKISTAVNNAKIVANVNTIEDLRFLDLQEGDAIALLGYYSPGDKNPVTYTYTKLNFGTLVDDGGSIIKATSGSWIADFHGVISPRDFGALADGTFDDTQAIQNMFNSNWVKAFIFFPVGFYRVQKTIDIPLNKEIVMEGEKSVSDGGSTPETRFNGMSSILWYGEDIADNVLFRFNDTQSRPRLRFLTFSNRTTRTDVDGLYFQDFRGAYLEYVYLNQFRNNIWVEGDCWYAKLEKCKLMQSKENGIYIKGLANGLKFEECRISSNLKKGAFFLKAASDVTFEGCYLEQNLEQAAYFTQPQLINFNHCHFENNGYEVITNPSQIYVGNYTDLNNTDVIINMVSNYIFSRGGINIIQNNAGVLGTGSKMISNLIGNYVSVTNNTKGNTCYFVNIAVNQNNNLINSINNVYKTLSVDVNTPVLTNVSLLNLKGFTAINDNSIGSTDSISLKSNRLLSNRVQFTNDFTVLGASIISGTGTPEGVYVSTVGSIYLDNAAGLNTYDRIYVKQTGTGNTGWVKLLASLATTAIEGIVKQSSTVANPVSTTLATQNTSSATDVAGIVSDFNTLVGKYNDLVAVANSLRDQLTAKLSADKASGQQAP